MARAAQMICDGGGREWARSLSAFGDRGGAALRSLGTAGWLGAAGGRQPPVSLTQVTEIEGHVPVDLQERGIKCEGRVDGGQARRRPAAHPMSRSTPWS